MSIFSKKVRSDKSISNFFNEFYRKQIKNDKNIIEGDSLKKKKDKKNLEVLSSPKKTNNSNIEIKSQSENAKSKKTNLKKESDTIIKFSKENLKKLIKIQEEKIFIMEKQFRKDESFLSDKLKNVRKNEINKEKKEYKKLLEIKNNKNSVEVKSNSKKISKKTEKKL
ncbi:MAG: hypothetical protein HPAVJP_5350 [Candidatus Hepatoplasma vulgare]|nr:MAG: hypothetical protein HPAVJP_5350 [Candidatus Hepatoplasma sp.]